MRLHRTARTRFFTTLGNEVLRDNRLSFCARGILGHLLSYPDGQRADIRTLTDRTPEGRERVAAALRELERFGYLRRSIKRTPDGRVYTDVDVFDSASGASSPVAPDAGFPGSGGPAAGSGGDHPVNQRDEEPSLPAPTGEARAGREDDDADQEIAASAALLARVARLEPKLILGRHEALQLAPLVARWRRRGASELHILHTLSAGLPPSVHHPARFIECRLRTKMPAEPVRTPPRLECEECRAPVGAAGLCRTCSQSEGSGPRVPAEFVHRLTRGAALARAALRGAPVAASLPALA